MPADPGGHTTFSLRRPADDYLRDIERCQEYLAAGESYEICLTNELAGPPCADTLSLHRVLRRVNPAPFAAFLRLGGVEVIGSSPERFLALDRHGGLEAKPIKGTVARGATPGEDREAAARLRAGAKDRAENLMIVDVLRNDLGRVAEIGSVSVPKLMGVESYATVHQLVSTVRARLRSDATIVDCLRASFPGGSMTGAPKARTMEIIDRLEARPRGIYSGAIGYFAANGSADLSIAIRTIVNSSRGMTIGAGGAITVQSDARAEVRELLLKARAPLQAVGLALHGRRDAARAWPRPAAATAGGRRRSPAQAATLGNRVGRPGHATPAGRRGHRQRSLSGCGTAASLRAGMSVTGRLESSPSAGASPRPRGRPRRTDPAAALRFRRWRRRRRATNATLTASEAGFRWRLLYRAGRRVTGVRACDDHRLIVNTEVWIMR